MAEAVDQFSDIPIHLKKIGANWRTFPTSMDKQAIRDMQRYVAYVNAGMPSVSRGMLLMGMNQTGKTGLAYCAYTQIPGSVFLTASKLFQHLRMANIGEAWEYAALLEKLESIPHLIIDDLGAEKVSDFRLEGLTIILNKRMNADVATTVTTNLTDSDLREHFGDRIYSRFMGSRCEKIIVSGDIGNIIL